jgi:hypothetical protein
LRTLSFTITRSAGRWPHALQVEVYFSIIQRKALSPNDFTDLDMTGQRLARFEDRYNAAAKPFK